MMNWEEYKFSEIININPHIELIKDNTYSFVEMKDLDNGRKFCYPSVERKLSGGARFKEKDTLFARITPCLENGKICQVKGLKNGLGFGSTEFLVFRGKDNLSDNDFVYYLSRSEEVRSFAEQNFDGTSGRQRVPKSTFENLTIALPPLPEQQAIANVLSSLDDKIDLLHRQNKTLESMAGTIFRKWFVEDADEGWEERKLGDIINVKHGYAFQGKYITENETNNILVTPGNFNIGGGFKNDKFKYYGNESFSDDYLFKENDLIITMTDLSKDTDTLGYPAFVPLIPGKKLLHNQRVGKIIFRNPELEKYKYFLYFIMKSNEYRAYILGSASGTSIMHTSPERICNYDLVLPDKETILKFNIIVKKLFDKIFINKLKILNLVKLRDLLLPKLMSGEVRVNI